jgi:hypothetical protein
MTHDCRHVDLCSVATFKVQSASAKVVRIFLRALVRAPQTSGLICRSEALANQKLSI